MNGKLYETIEVSALWSSNATMCVHADLALGWEQGAGTECTHHVQWTMKACGRHVWFVIENEILSLLIHISRFDFIPCAFKY